MLFIGLNMMLITPTISQYIFHAERGIRHMWKELCFHMV